MIDGIGLALIVVGATCFVIAHLGLERLHAEGVVLVAKGQAFGKLAEWQRWAWLWWGGLCMVVVGVGVAGWSTVRHRRSTLTLPPAGENG
jgi:hypothetical protein